jgi:hypothetical protein
MRDRQARRSSTRTGLLFLATVTGGAFALSGVPSCADALHLEPPITDAGMTTDAPSEAGVDGGATCSSSLDCTYPTGTCDPNSHTCVGGCVSNGDCADQPGTVCSQGACTCPPVDGSTLTYCPGASGGCVDLTNSPANCGGCGSTCFGNCTASACAGGWTQTAMTGAPEPRSHHVSVWTGTQMFVWGGQDGTGGSVFFNDGGLYDPVKQVWTPTSAVNAPDPRADATAVWDDVKNVVIVWGGTGPAGVLLNSGGVYDPAANTWTPMPPSTALGVPAARTDHTAVWDKGYVVPTTMTMGAMIVWGGNTAPNAPTNDGAIYDPAGNNWVSPVDTTGAAPTARAFHTAVWDATGTGRMVVYGGFGVTKGDGGAAAALADAYAFDPTMPSGMAWTELPDGPPARLQHTAVWEPTTATTIVWGGTSAVSPLVLLQDGAGLTAVTTATPVWATLNDGATPSPNPEPRVGHTAVLVTPTAAGAGPQMLIFGGDQGPPKYLNTLWSYDIKGTMAWLIPSPATAPSARSNHTAVGYGATMIVWGGDTADGPTNTGAVFDASSR